MIHVSLVRARSVVAHGIVGAADTITTTTIGDVVLLPAQRETLRRVRDALARFQGALVANDVGSGKTYVALAAASQYRNPVLLAPASLHSMWLAASQRAGRPLPFVSLESLGRGRPPPQGHDLVVVDEAHHLRNPRTRTYRAAQIAVRGAATVLLTATPTHNRPGDLDALLALFLSADPRDLDDEQRSRVIIRDAVPAGGPSVVTHSLVGSRDEHAFVRRILALPPPVAVRDGGVATMLFRLAVLRAWCSSASACAEILRRSLLRGAALLDAARAGRHLSRTELAAWSPVGQLAFAELLSVDVAQGADGSHGVQLAAAELHLDAIASLHAQSRMLLPLDDDRAAQIAAIADAHAGVPVLACSQYAATVHALWSRLRARSGTAALTSVGARIASGPIDRASALARFAPVAQGVPAPHARERIDLLLSTDLVSEGVNLHDAGVVIHLDLPWTAARLAQRVGRIARLGSPHTEVHAYTVAPPQAAAKALALARRIRIKRRMAVRLVGGEARLASLIGDDSPARRGAAKRIRVSAAEARTRINTLLSPLLLAADVPPCAEPMVSAVGAPKNGWLALVGNGDAARLLVRLGGAAPSTDPHRAMRAVDWLLTGDEATLNEQSVRRALDEAERWLAHDRGRHVAGLDRRHAARTHGHARATTVATVAAAPSHLRARAARAAADSISAMSALAGERARTEEFVAPHEPLVRVLILFCAHDAPAPRTSA